MYHAHFGLEKSLFGDGIAADSAVFRSPKHDQLIASFKLALGSPSSAIVLRGPAGVGKTTLTSAALRASSTRLALAWLNGMPTNAAELLELVLVELGLGTARTTRIERLQLWRQFQAETRATESRLFVVVERTEDFTPEVLHALDSLTAPDAAGNLGANVVLIGHAGIDEHLGAPILDSLRQRIRLRAELAPFTEAELQDYFRHQIACAGGHFDHVFAPGSVAALYRHSKGIARLAKNLCETALDYAASQQKKLLTPELVNHTAVALLGLDDVTPAAAAAAAAIPTTPLAAPPPAISPAAVTAAPVMAAAVSAPLPPPVAVVASAPVVVTPAPTPVVPAPATAVAAAPAPVVAATPTPVSAPAPIVTAPVPPPAVPTPSAAARAATPPAAAVPVHVPFEYDGGATDITDVALADFPVLTDAVELPVALPPIKRVIAAAPPTSPATAVAPPAAAKTPASPAPVARTAEPAPTAPAAAKPAASRVETAYAPKPPAAKAAPVTAPSPPPALPQKPAAPPSARITPSDPEADDVLRQTQTMRAISVAKSIDDISSSMAETLFGDAELDLMTAALASAADWPADEQPPSAPPAAAPSKPAPAAAKAEAPPPPIDDPFDLFGLGDDAPLELIDDSTLPPIDKPRKTAAR